MTGPLLKIDNLSIEFGSQRPIRVIEGIGFEVPESGAVGIVGESGSGKSVTSLAIMRLIASPPGRIVSGSIDFRGTDLLGLSAAQMPEIRGRDIAMIFQEPMSSLNPVMTIGSQIGEAIKLHEALDRRARRRKVVDLLRRVGIPDPEARADAYPHEFSGGMRQRAMIAMAMACGPKLLIADEPTTALDVTVQAQVMELMKRLRRETGMALLLISHDLGVIADACDRVIVMYAGRIVEEADTRDLFAHPRHPYTRGLLAAIPRLSTTEKRLAQIPGAVPPAGTIRKGCPFAARCTQAIDKCREEMPPLIEAAKRHRAACWVTA